MIVTRGLGRGAAQILVAAGLGLAAVEAPTPQEPTPQHYFSNGGGGGLQRAPDWHNSKRAPAHDEAFEEEAILLAIIRIVIESDTT